MHVPVLGRHGQYSNGYRLGEPMKSGWEVQMVGAVMGGDGAGGSNYPSMTL